jgi:translation elongation factor EF-G
MGQVQQIDCGYNCSCRDASALFTVCLLAAAGVQPLLDGVSDYLPCPTDVENIALDIDHEEKALTLPCR